MLTRAALLRRGLVGALVVGGIATGSAIAEDAPAPETVTPTATQPAAIGATQLAQTRALRVFRRAERASDTMTAGAAATAGPGRFGRNPELARSIETPTGTGWVVPGDDTVCLVMPDPVDGYATSCAPTEVVAAEGLTVGLADEDSSIAVTLVPDGATVVVTGDDGRRNAVQPDGAGVVAVDAQDAEHLAVVTDAGTSTTPLLDAEELSAASPR